MRKKMDCIDYILDGNLFYWVSEINAAIEHIKQNSCIIGLNRRLEYMYIHAPLTDHHLSLCRSGRVKIDQ